MYAPTAAAIAAYGKLVAYFTDLGFASILPATPPAKPRDRTLTLARVRHGGTSASPQDWDAAAACWPKLAPYVQHVTGCALKEISPVTLGQDALDGEAAEGGLFDYAEMPVNMFTMRERMLKQMLRSLH